MKKILLLIVLVSFLGGCHKIHDEIRGSGKVRKEMRAIGNFTSIATEGALEIEVVCQKPVSLEIEGDDNILPLISTEVSNNVLHIKNNRGYSVHRPIVVRISVPDLAGISASGAGTIDVSELKNEKFELDVSGAPEIKAAGETKALTIDASGAARIDTHRLRAAQVAVDSKGVSTVEVYASEHLDATVSGPSHVVYRGNAVVNRTIHGPGSIEKRESEGS